MRITIGEKCPFEIRAGDKAEDYLRTPLIFEFDESKLPNFEGLAKLIETLGEIDPELLPQLIKNCSMVEACSTGKPNQNLFWQ